MKSCQSHAYLDSSSSGTTCTTQIILSPLGLSKSLVWGLYASASHLQTIDVLIHYLCTVMAPKINGTGTVNLTVILFHVEIFCKIPPIEYDGLNSQ